MTASACPDAARHIGQDPFLPVQAGDYVLAGGVQGTAVTCLGCGTALVLDPDEPQPSPPPVVEPAVTPPKLTREWTRAGFEHTYTCGSGDLTLPVVFAAPGISLVCVHGMTLTPVGARELAGRLVEAAAIADGAVVPDAGGEFR